MDQEIIYVFVLQETATGLCLYKDAGGNVQSVPVTANISDIFQKDAPDGWMDSALGFMRNMTKYGLNRSFTIPQKLISDMAYIVRSRMNRGRGIQEALTLMILKYNDDPQPGEPLFELEYKGQLDLPNARNKAGESLQVNLMEGGFMQLMKAAENTIIEIPCDGSIPENIKVNMDGMLFEDTFNYNIVAFNSQTAGAAGLPCVFMGNDGDNAGIIHSDPSFDPVVSAPFPDGTYYQNSQNYIFASAAPITVRIRGQIVIASSVPNKGIFFSLFLATSKSVDIGTFPGLSNTTGLVPSQYGIEVPVNGQQVFNFDQTVTLDANERLFLMFATLNNTDTNFHLIGGNFTMAFNSMFPATYPWGITWYDVARLLVQNICQTFSTPTQIFNYGFRSKLLQDNINLVLTSGDALRASGDPLFQRFYNAIQNNPNFPNLNTYYSYGPVLKTTWADCFTSIDALKNASMSTQIIPGENETVFIESKGYVFDASIVNLDNGEVVDFEDAPAIDLYFTLFRIGYEPQTDDQKAGKYAWNTAAEWILPINSIPFKKFEVICKYQSEPYLMERLRSNTGDTSTTRNNSNSTVFILDTDPTKFKNDSFKADFKSLIQDTTQAGNTNILMTHLLQLQSINIPNIIGSYFTFSNAASIFLFNQPALSGGSFTLGVSITGNLLGYLANSVSGLPADSVTINLVINGVIIQTWVTVTTGASTPIAISYSVPFSFSYKDSIYFTVSTSVNGTADITNCTLTLSNGGPYLTAIGSNIEIQPGVALQLLDLPLVTAALDGHNQPVISSGFQYFLFNSFAINHNFDVFLQVKSIIDGFGGEQGGWDVYLNGQALHSQRWTETSGLHSFEDSYSFNRDFQDGDIVFMVGSATNLSVWFTEAHVVFTSTQIKAIDLYREQYDAISGIPLLLGNLPGTAVPITTGAGAPYNIRLSPKRMLMAWGNYLRSILYDQIPGVVKFSSLSKNENLSTTINGVTITENANVSISDFDSPLFFARYFFYKAMVKETFAKIMTGAANGHAVCTANGIPFYSFPMEMKQKPTLNPMQDWKMLASPRSDLTQLIDFNYDGLNFMNMGPNTIRSSFLNSVKFVVEGAVLNPKYHTPQRDQFWFSEQISKWINRNNYWNPWQSGDPIPLQFISRDLTQVVVNLYSSVTKKIVSTTACTMVSSNAIVAPYHLFEVNIDVSGLTDGYFLQAVGGTGETTSRLIGEGLDIQVDHPKTLLFEYSHSVNKQTMIFDTGFKGRFRVKGFYDNLFKPKYVGAFYKNQGQSGKILNAFPYEVTDLYTGLGDGHPNYVAKQIARILLLDGTTIEGEGFMINEGAEWEPTFIQGNPKMFQKIVIQPTNNADGVTANPAGADTDASMMITVDAQAFGPNAGNAGGPNPNIITVTINS